MNQNKSTNRNMKIRDCGCQPFIRIEDGCALIQMGKCKDNVDYQQKVNSNFAILVPARTWHNIVNVGNVPLKLYSVYAPPKHPFGTVHRTKGEAQCAERH